MRSQVLDLEARRHQRLAHQRAVVAERERQAKRQHDAATLADQRVADARAELARLEGRAG